MIPLPRASSFEGDLPIEGVQVTRVTSSIGGIAGEDLLFTIDFLPAT